MSVSTWEDLAALRAQGKRPGLRLIVTDRKRFCWGLHGVGCMTILHEAGKPMPLELLDGLDVILDFGCERAGLVSRAMRAKSVSPARCEAWCRCEKDFTTCVGRCGELAEIDSMFEEASARK